MAKFINLTGRKFGKLTVIERVEKPKYLKNTGAWWKCECECRNIILAKSSSLKSGHTKSCGCLNKVCNIYKLTKNHCIGYTNKGQEFYFDLEDFEKIKDYYWYINDQGYVITKDIKNNVKCIRFHRFVFKVKDNEIIDHIDNKRNNNQKSNLRIANKSTNGINRGINSNNILGAKGIIYDKRCKKYTAKIMKNYKSIYLGAFDSIDNAIKARKDAEVKYFGEFAYKEE